MGSSIWYNKHIKLKNRYTFWKDWLTYGLKWTHQLFQDGICITFSVLQSHFSLPSSYHSNYISLPAAAQASYNSLTSFHAPTPSTPITTSFLSISPSASLIYKKLMDIPISRDKSDVECSWESDLGESFPIPIWNKIWTKIRKSSRAANTTQTLFYIYNRLLITPAKLHLINPTTPSSCWSCSAPVADLKHMLFLCPHIHDFWDKVWKQINRILHSHFPFSLTNLFLGSVSDVWSSLTTSSTIVDLLLAVAFQQITKSWKNASNVSFQAWWFGVCYNHRVDRAYVYPLTLAIKRDLLWQPITDFFNVSAHISSLHNPRTEEVPKPP